MEFVKTKTILTKVKYGNDWYGVDYNMKDIIKAYKKETKDNEQIRLF